MEMVQSAHKPFFYEAEGSDTAVLLIHGIMGSPNQFEGIARRLADAGCSAKAILLSGHGGSADDFANAKAADWLRETAEAAASLRQRFRRVILLGHSMGGLLALGEAVQHSTDKVILMSVPMRLKTNLRGAVTSLRVLWGNPARDDGRLGGYRRAFSVQPGSLRQYLSWASPLREVRDLMAATRRRLNQIRQPVLIIQSRRDETVSWRSAGILKQGLCNAAEVHMMILDKSEHAYHHPDETGAIDERIIAFVKAECR